MATGERVTEFLPLCDVLFNIISMAGYFCDVVFEFLLSYALYERGNRMFVLVIGLVIFSLVISQIVSLKWFLRNDRAPANTEDAIDQQSADGDRKITQQQPQHCVYNSKAGRYTVFVLHFFQLGILWRYAKLFVPVDLRKVKNEVRDLCMLRLLHAFCEAAPMLLLQLHVLVSLHLDEYQSTGGGSPELRLKTLSTSPATFGRPQPMPSAAILSQQNRTFKDLNTISAALSLFSVCWALASFSKNVRLQNVHRLVLTWLGVIFQFLWRLGTVVSRVTALTVYASLYHHWIFLVIVLHWMSMLLWLISPKNVVFRGEKISSIRKATLSAMIAFVYVFAYINLQEVNHRQKMITFYIVMFLENLLLVCLWMVGIWPERPIRWYLIPVTVLASFLVGILFMVIYYRYFHVRRLGYESGGRPPDEINYGSKCCSLAKTKHCKCKKSIRGGGSCGGEPGTKYHGGAVVPGVFNCRFTNPVNGATKRKKKKPTSFVPPPNIRLPTTTTPQSPQMQSPSMLSSPLSDAAAISAVLHHQQQQQQQQSLDQIMTVPFWKRPLSLSQNGSSENESSVGSRVNIQQKLQEKKQKQLAELKVIEEEIKQGKLGPSNLMGTLSSNDDTGNGAGGSGSGGGGGGSGGTNGNASRQSLPRQPIPRIKKHIDLDPTKFWAQDDNGGYSNLMMLHQEMYLHQTSEATVAGTGQITAATVAAAAAAAATASNAGVAAGGGNTTNNLNMPNSNETLNNGNNSLTRATAIPAKVPRSATYHQNIQATSSGTGSSVNIPQQQQQQQQQPQQLGTNTTNSNKSNTSGGGGAAAARMQHYHENNFQNLRQISGMYNALQADGGGTADGQFPYNVIPPPKNKLDSNRGTPTIVPPPQRQTPAEVLLAPHHFLEQQHLPPRQGNNNGAPYYDWVAGNVNGAGGVNVSGGNGVGVGMMSSEDDEDNTMYHPHFDHNKVPSDIDSQMSLPRSYTLPREFKYYRRNKSRKMENFVASNNSSDGDVDSVDDNESHHNSSNNLRANLNGAQPNKYYHHNLMGRRHHQQQHQQQQQLSPQYQLHPSQPQLQYSHMLPSSSGGGGTPTHYGGHHYGNVMISGRVSVPAVAGYQQPIYLNAPVAIMGTPQRSSFVPNLDLISNVMDSVVANGGGGGNGNNSITNNNSNQAMIRQMRMMRGLNLAAGGSGNGGGGVGVSHLLNSGQVRHETKL